MPTIHRERGIAFRMYSNDHGPPHVHAVTPDGYAKLALGTEHRSTSVLKVGQDMKLRDLLRAVRIVNRERKSFLDAWRRMHGETNIG